MAKKALEGLVLSAGAVKFTPRSFEVSASNNAGAQTVRVTLNVPITEAQALVEAAKAAGAVAAETSESGYGKTVRYNAQGGEAGGFVF